MSGVRVQRRHSLLATALLVCLACDEPRHDDGRAVAPEPPPSAPTPAVPREEPARAANPEPAQEPAPTNAQPPVQPASSAASAELELTSAPTEARAPGGVARASSSRGRIVVHYEVLDPCEGREPKVAVDLAARSITIEQPAGPKLRCGGKPTQYRTTVRGLPAAVFTVSAPGLSPVQLAVREAAESIAPVARTTSKTEGALHAIDPFVPPVESKRSASGEVTSPW